MSVKNIAFVFLLFFSIQVTGQYSYSGKIIDENSEALQGAVILFDNGERTAITDLNGEFLFQNVAGGQHTVEVQYLGYENQMLTFDLQDSETALIAISERAVNIEQVDIIANRLSKDSPFSYVELNEEAVNIKNLAQDIPFLLEHTPSMVVTSDAGSGVGYTGMRIRGSDATRINVTINGVPLNDSESQGVFWVNMPDFGSSVQNVQIQRGVGSSTNGAASFGGTVALNTSSISEKPFGKVSGTYGSFDTRKLSFEGGSGLINGQYSIEGRYSMINSDGYVDRASSDLDSWFLSAAKIGDNHSLRLNVISGDERTYQSWWGVPESKLGGTDGDVLNHYFTNLGVTYNTVADSTNLFQSDRRYNYYLYDDQVDDYGQDHYQLIYNVQPQSNLTLNGTLHYTKGQGFFEEFRGGDDLIDYGISIGDIETSDLVRRRWLDNDFYGIIANANYEPNEQLTWLTGVGYNRYIGDHFGEVIAVDAMPQLGVQQPYYNSTGEKNDFNIYTKLNYQLSENLSLYGDLQLRMIDYITSGIDNDAVPIDVDESYTFFNPKFGLNYSLDETSSLYLSYAQANREPVRSDFIDAIGTNIPKPERLHDFELGFRSNGPSLSFEANAYYMLYNDQLVLTGAVNDVGGSVRTNVDKSFRRGVELSLAWKPSDKIMWSPNIAFSQNKIDQFTDVVIDFADFSLVETNQADTDIAFSPNIIFGSALTYNPVTNGSITLLSKYVGDQFLDNNSNEDRKIDAYFVNDIIASYSLKNTFAKDVTLKFLVNNILSETYSSNGYTFSYIFGDLITENFYYPQATRNFLIGLDIMF